MTVKHVLVALACGLLAATAHAQAPDPMPRVTPEEAGFSAERLARIGTVLNQDIETGRIPGAVLAIARNGKLVYFQAFGYRDKAAGVKMTTDTIFNIASMTKPMTAVGALSLVEQGRLMIDEPISRTLPGFTDMKVAVMNEDGSAITSLVPANRPITMRDLLTHTSGLVYGSRGTTAVHKLYPAGSISNDFTGPEFVAKLSSLPLMAQPGSTWDYGFGLDLTGQMVETVTKQTLGNYLSDTVFKPLGMVDTGFQVPPDKINRYAHALPNDPETGKPQTLADLTKSGKFESGGGGAVSTASDYLKFASMLLNGGEYDGQRILSPKMTQYMLTNQLGPQVRNLIVNADPTRADYGFGLGLAVRTTPGVVRLMGSVGDFSWPGASGTNWWADPAEKLVVVFMAHSPGTVRWHYRYLINTLVYQAMER
jgi:CubicO group peptidase (beta-lactamase class C family)